MVEKVQSARKLLACLQYIRPFCVRSGLSFPIKTRWACVNTLLATPRKLRSQTRHALCDNQLKLRHLDMKKVVRHLSCTTTSFFQSRTFYKVQARPIPYASAHLNSNARPTAPHQILNTITPSVHRFKA